MCKSTSHRLPPGFRRPRLRRASVTRRINGDPRRGHTPAPMAVYVLHSGNLYGTERMALDTLTGLRAEFDPVLVAPPGAALEAAAALGFRTIPFSGQRGMTLVLFRLLRDGSVAALLTTSVVQSLMAAGSGMLLNRHFRHLHVVHAGSPDDTGSYGHKRLLNPLPLSIVAVSRFVKEKLLQHGVREDRISVIPNFLSDERLAAFERRPPFAQSGVRRIAVVSRLDPMKRVDLLCDVLEAEPSLADLEFRIYGTGTAHGSLRQRIDAAGLNVRLAGFTPHIEDELAQSEALLHLCPTEPFGLAVLEAFAAGLPVIVPDAGGAAEIVGADGCGFLFRADDPADLARVLRTVRGAGADELNRKVDGGRQLLRCEYRQRVGIRRYLRLLVPGQNPPVFRLAFKAVGLDSDTDDGAYRAKARRR